MRVSLPSLYPNLYTLSGPELLSLYNTDTITCRCLPHMPCRCHRIPESALYVLAFPRETKDYYHN